MVCLVFTQRQLQSYMQWTVLIDTVRHMFGVNVCQYTVAIQISVLT